MKQTMMAALAAAILVLAGHGTLRAAGQPQCDTVRKPAASGQQAGARTDGAVPGQQYGTQGNVEAKKEVDAQKYQTAQAGSANEACPDSPAAAKDASSGQKQ